MDYRNLQIVGYGLALIGCLTIGASHLLAEGLVFSERADSGIFVLGSILALVFGLRNVLAKTDHGYDLEHSVAYRVANCGAAILVVGSGLLLFVVGVVSLVFG